MHVWMYLVVEIKHHNAVANVELDNLLWRYPSEVWKSGSRNFLVLFPMLNIRYKRFVANFSRFRYAISEKGPDKYEVLFLYFDVRLVLVPQVFCRYASSGSTSKMAIFYVTQGNIYFYFLVLP